MFSGYFLNDGSLVYQSISLLVNWSASLMSWVLSLGSQVSSLMSKRRIYASTYDRVA
jgi:hypothetical protein